jgi:hypothetical protein
MILTIRLTALLGQFGKSKWQSYFELFHLPMEMQRLKPSVLMGKLKQHFRLPPSMHETVGAGNHKTAAAMMKAADALWDAQGSHDPTVVAVTTQRNRSPAPNNGKRGDTRSSNARSKSCPFPP